MNSATRSRRSISAPASRASTRSTAKLEAGHDWQLVAVPGLVPDLTFFDHLANRRFR
jgi:phenylalanine-4-hydroxylase